VRDNRQRLEVIIETCSKLRAQGTPRDEDQACTYARTRIDQYRASAAESPDV